LVIKSFVGSECDLFVQTVPAFKWKLEKVMKNAADNPEEIPNWHSPLHDIFKSFNRYTTKLGMDTQLGWRNHETQFSFWCRHIL
jgi:hypothetical protein